MFIWLYYLLLLLFSLIGVALVLLTLPGLWLMTAGAAIYALLTHREFIGNKSLLALLALTILAELADTFLGSAAAKKAGGGRRAMLGAFLGATAGAIALAFIPIIGSIIGACLGSFIGAAAFELAGGSHPELSLRVGIASAKGKLAGFVAKLAVGVVMLVLILIAGLPI